MYPKLPENVSVNLPLESADRREHSIFETNFKEIFQNRGSNLQLVSS